MARIDRVCGDQWSFMRLFLPDLCRQQIIRADALQVVSDDL
jgi:hypothetical protein